MTFQLGSISTGTLKTEDLLPIFVAEATARGVRFIDGAGNHFLTNEPGGRNTPTLDLLTEALNNLCPPFVYFGIHPGNGADFGFWPDWDDLEERCSPNASYRNGEEWAFVDCIVHWPQPFGDNLVIVMNLDRNVLWSTV